ncbi:MAG: hypothetical protein EZS28_041282 [Streblomastix strix]|uniref:Uncharacterized protein n=1 Tax=Streblomastix strix TaxID=222440 RepID=A0A5J4TYQ4_9EUKA|nr:MAG: hypothetical protein EZS28_041282 [Streblomastix strix]
MSILCGGKCSIIIQDIISSRNSSSSDSSALLCVGGIDLYLCLCYQSHSVGKDSSSIREVCCCEYAGIGGINVLCTLLVDVVLCRDLSTVYVAACSIY